MARLFNSGAETGDLTEWSASSGTIAASTVQKLSGTYSFRANPSASTGYLRRDLFGTDQTSIGYIRAWVFIQSYPSTTIQLIAFTDVSDVHAASLRLNGSGQMSLNRADGTGVLTSDRLLLGVWYCIEIMLDGSTATSALQARVNGITLGTGNNSSATDWGRIVAGAITPNSTVDVYLDDISANDSSGGSENTYPGVRKLAYSSGYTDEDITQPTLTTPTLARSTPYESGSGGYLGTHTISGFNCSGTNTLLLVWAFNRNVSTELTGITADGNAMTFIRAFDGGSTAGVALYGLLVNDASVDIAASTPTFKLLGMVAECWENVDQTSLTAALRQNGYHNSFTASAVHRKMAALNDNAIVVGTNIQNDRTCTAISNFTEDQNFAHADSNMGQCLAGHCLADVGATAGWTLSASDNFRSIAVEIMGTSAGGNVTVTPATASLTLTTFAPTVTVSDHKTVTPTTLALSLATFAPTVTASDHKTVTPGTAALTLSTFAPTVTVSDNKTVTPGTTALSITTFAPTVTVTQNVVVTPTTASLSLMAFAPTVSVTDHQLVTPGTAALTLATFAPTVTVGNNIVVTPGVASLTLTAFEPTVVVSNNITVTPGTASLTLSAFAPTVSISDHKVVTPGTASLTISTFAPTVTATGNVVITPGTLALSLSAFAPTVTVSDNVTVVPGTASLTLSAFVPTVTVVSDLTVTPDPAALVLTAYAPTVSVSDNITVTPTTLSLVLATFVPTVTVGLIIGDGVSPATWSPGSMPSVTVSAGDGVGSATWIPGDQI